ncbi:YeeE/YedE family protein [Flavobacterium amniphilum]|uniref:YeeE/YedE thiosulfate transporter family protein n=1 Tax=Flavobacterium amniphilum TaxID=1834035 RepID=UPI002029FE84|nr:YeeE/YedE thiosulfate transporter family protein [Flavobacterium amniphilum]MCL9806627.1 YeeE/YedE family protein [Flavobacterium amniphilum]
MKLFRFFAVGMLFGIVLTKAEAVSWYRIYEMFMFQSFHMYGIIGVAVFTGVCGLMLIKKKGIKDYKGMPIEILDKEKGFVRYIAGGFLFGLGWALVGSCPGPIFILLGAGVPAVAIVLFGALLGTFVYGMIKDKLPH